MTRRCGPLPRRIVLGSLAVGLSVAWLAEPPPPRRPLGPLPAAASRDLPDLSTAPGEDWGSFLGPTGNGRSAARGIAAPAGAASATETPGAAIDRLSILELRRYHMREQAERADATPEHREKAAGRLVILDLQRDHLVEAADRLLTEIFAGQRPLRVFRQMKMYNDPAMNPYLYKARQS